MSHLKEPGPTGADGNDGVGYGRPPRASRFRPGQSGNPAGRPKGTRNFKTDLKATLETLVKVTRDGKARKISTQEAMLLRLREQALSGNSRALDRLILLAQTYNNEDLTASSDLSASDESILQIFKARVLSGAAALNGSVEDGERTIEDDSSENSGSATETTASKKMRLNRRVRPDDGRVAVDEHRSKE